MKFGANFRNNLALAATAAGLAVGCTTVVPDKTEAKQPSFDAGGQNSGFLGFDATGNGIITEHARQRYDGLITRYGSRFIPQIDKDNGLTSTNANWRITPQALVNFETMNTWLKEAK